MKFAITPTILFDATGAPIDITVEGGFRALEVRDERLHNAVLSALLAARAIPADPLPPQPVVLPTGASLLASSIPVGLALDQVVPVTFPQPISVNAQILGKGDGLDVAQGSTNDAMVLGDSPGSVSAKLRGINFHLQELRKEVRESNGLLFLILNAIQSQVGVSQPLS